MRHTSVITKILLVAAFLVAAAVRVGYFYRWNTEPQKAPATRPAGTLTADEALRRDMFPKEGFNGTVARNLLATGRFAGWSPLSGREPWRGSPDEPAPGTAFVAPGYPVLLAAVYKLAGPTNFRILFLVQAIIGALGTIFAFYLARRLFGSTLAGWLAWLAAAGSYFLISAVVKVDAFVLAGTMVTWSVLTIAAAADTASFWRHLLAGVVAGLTVLVVPVFLIALPFAYLWTLSYGEGSAGKRFGLSLVCVLAFLIVVAPWSIRNYRVFGTPIPITDSLGYHAWVGNNSKATGGDRVRADRSVLDAGLADEDRERYTAVGLEVRRFRTMGCDAWKWMLDNPFRSIQLRLHAYFYFWLGQNLWLEDKLDYEHPLVVPVTAMMLLLALIGIGARKTDRQRSRAWMIYIVLLLYPIPFALTHVTSLPTSRLVIDPLVLVLAAYAVATFLTGGRIGRARAVAGGAAVRPVPTRAGRNDIDLAPLR